MESGNGDPRRLSAAAGSLSRSAVAQAVPGPSQGQAQGGCCTQERAWCRPKKERGNREIVNFLIFVHTYLVNFTVKYIHILQGL